MSRQPGSLLKFPEEATRRKLVASKNKALQGAFERIRNQSRFSAGIPKVVNYDDFQYDDCGHDDTEYDR